MTLALQLPLAPDVHAPGPAPPLTAGAFVQILSGAVAAFCLQHELDFDERALLEHLLDTAERASGFVKGCTPTGLARDLGLGPSGRRTLTARLGRLVAAGAIEWDPGSTSIEILVHHQLVRAGRGDHRAGYVQILPGAVASVAARHRLSASARAVLRRLLVDVDHRSRSTTGSIRQLTAHYRISRDRLTAGLDELVEAGLVRREADGIHVCAYDQLVRASVLVAEPREPRLDRAPAAVESRGDRVENARPSSPLDARHQDLTLCPPTNAPPPPPVTKGEGPELSTTWETVVERLAPHHRTQVLVDANQAGGRRLARRRFDELVGLVGVDTAVDQATADWPLDVMWPVGFLLRRLERRVAEAREGADALERIEVTDAEARAATAAAAIAAAAATADLQRRQECQEARRQGIDFARRGQDRMALAQLHALDAEALAAALAGYEAGAAARDHGAARAEAGDDRSGLSDDFDGELLWAAQTGYDAARTGSINPSPSAARSADRAPQEPGDGPAAARAALRCRQADWEPEGDRGAEAEARGGVEGHGDKGSDTARAGPARRFEGAPRRPRAGWGVSGRPHGADGNQR